MPRRIFLVDKAATLLSARRALTCFATTKRIVLGSKKISTHAAQGAPEKPLTGSTPTWPNASVEHDREAVQRA